MTANARSKSPESIPASISVKPAGFDAQPAAIRVKLNAAARRLIFIRINF
jgi:hypothetical protein